MQPKYAVHVATAPAVRAARLDTFDGPLMGLNGQVGGDPPLLIAVPTLAEQASLPFPGDAGS